MNRRARRWLLALGLVVCALIFSLYQISRAVVRAADPYVFETAADLPPNDVGLVLGTSTYTRGGGMNPLFAYRMDAAAILYRAGKIKHLLVSGANPDETYNEPRKMYQALIGSGVPPEAITMDFAGFRTLDSVVRAQQVFGLSRYTVISQRFHCYRAVYIARHKGADVVAYATPEITRGLPLRTRAREFLARLRAVLDVRVFDTQPRHLGEPVQLQIAPTSESTLVPGDLPVTQTPINAPENQSKSPDKVR
ncbi:MAG: SanA/YdcF family protein [Nevskiales bacterium]